MVRFSRRYSRFFIFFRTNYTWCMHAHVLVRILWRIEAEEGKQNWDQLLYGGVYLVFGILRYIYDVDILSLIVPKCRHNTGVGTVASSSLCWRIFTYVKPIRRESTFLSIHKWMRSLKINVGFLILYLLYVRMNDTTLVKKITVIYTTSYIQLAVCHFDAET